LITDAEGVLFLQWCLPQLHLRWPGFRKVRRQVYKRIHRRLLELSLRTIGAYRTYLEDHPDEWATLDGFCWISISRFYRDQAVFQHLEHEILPTLARVVLGRGESELRCWSAGCAGGEEPYSLALLWHQGLASQFPALRLRILATDIDSGSIERAKRGCYQATSLKQLPLPWRAQAFVTSGNKFCLKDKYRDAVTFLVHDLRQRAPDGLFDLIFCRNLAFTYFDPTAQRETLEKLTNKLASGGVLIIGKLESLPGGKWEIQPWPRHMGIYRKLLAQTARTVSVSQA